MFLTSIWIYGILIKYPQDRVHIYKFKSSNDI